MEYLNNLKENINSIVNYFYKTETQNEPEKEIKFIKYKDFMISDDEENIDTLKQLINRFNTICESVPDKSIEYYNLPNLTLKESIFSLDILISRTDLMYYLAKNKNDYTEEVIGVISKLYLNIYKIYTVNIEQEKDIIKKAQLNFDSITAV